MYYTRDITAYLQKHASKFVMDTIMANLAKFADRAPTDNGQHNWRAKANAVDQSWYLHLAETEIYGKIQRLEGVKHEVQSFV